MDSAFTADDQLQRTSAHSQGREHSAAEALFAGPGEMRALCRTFDWSATALGPVEGWSHSLRTTARTVLASRNPMFLFWGPELVQLYNDAYRPSLGNPVPGTEGRHPRALGERGRAFWTDIWDVIGPQIEQVMTTGEATWHEDQYLPIERNGGWEDVWWTYSYSPVWDDDGRIAATLVVCQETTGRVSAQRERDQLLAERTAEREALHSVILNMPSPLALLVGPEHRFHLVNDAYRRISGGGRDIIGLSPREAFPELVESGIFERLDQVFESGEPWYSPETPARYDRDGTGIQDTWFDLRLQPLRDSAGEVYAILNFAVDVTEQVRARLQAERAGEVARTVATCLAEGVCMMDSEGRLTYMNPAAERILGWAQAELVGDVLHDRVHYLHPDGRHYPIDECPLGQVLREGRAVLGLADQWVRRDGSFVHVVTTCAPILEDGRVVGAVLSLHDDTERRRTEAERELLLEGERLSRVEAEANRAEAEAANRAKSEFLAVMSHELRTPLNAIGGYAELMEMGIHGPVTQKQREALARIQTSQRHLLGLINEVLNYAKLETGMVHYDLVDLPLGEAIAAAESLVAPQARAKGLTLIAQPPAAMSVRADAEKLRQVLVNLLSNAVKFTDPGGRVEIECSHDAGFVRVGVRDTGIGIPADKLEAIFDPFVQVRSDLTRLHEGTGLGLAISRDLARGMGGDLSVVSEPGAGSTFTLSLPAA